MATIRSWQRRLTPALAPSPALVFSAALLVLLALLTLPPAAPGPVAAQPGSEVVDQEQRAVTARFSINDGPSPTSDACLLRGQTFTAARTGQLTRVELSL